MTYPGLNNLKILSINTQAGNNENWLLLFWCQNRVKWDQLKWI